MKLGPISWWRVAVSVALLGGLGYWLDGRTILGRLAQLKLGWVASAIVLSVFQVTLSAWRWRFTAARLGLVLPLRRAIQSTTLVYSLTNCYQAVSSVMFLVRGVTARPTAWGPRSKA